jgi:hypothetical protein
MQHLLLVVIPWRLRINFGLPAKAVEVLRKFSEILAGHICHGLERRRLEVFETSVIEDLSY